MLRHDFLLNLISEFNYTENELEERFTYLDLHLSASAPVMLLIARKDPDRDTVGEKTSNRIYMIREVIHEYLGNFMEITSIINKPFEITSFIQPRLKDTERGTPAAQWNELYTLVTGTLERIQFVCKELCGTTVSFALASKPCAWENTYNAYTSLTNALNCEFGFDRETLVDDKCLYNDKKKEAQRYGETDVCVLKLHTKASKLGTFLETNNINAFIVNVKEIINELRSGYELTSGIGIEAFFMLSLKLMSYINYTGIRELFSDCMDRFTNIHAYCSWDDVEQFIIETGRMIINYKFNKNAEYEKNIVAEVNEYIDSRLHEDISLATIAEHVHFNPFYLSRLYKRLAGKSISDYITDIRLHTAKKLLKQKDMKISDVVDSLGFSNHAYFTRFFKRYENMTPSEYRNSH